MQAHHLLLHPTFQAAFETETKILGGFVKTAKINTKESEVKVLPTTLVASNSHHKIPRELSIQSIFGQLGCWSASVIIGTFSRGDLIFFPPLDLFSSSPDIISHSPALSLARQNQISAFLWVTRIRRHCSGVCSNSCTSAFSLFKDSEWKWSSG